MKDLIESLGIFMKYFGDVGYPFHCEHDILYFCGWDDMDKISKEDKELLEDLGWNFYPDSNEISSFKYGSC